MATVVVLYQQGLLPGWAVGWISSDRETQKRQTLRVLYGIFAWWIVTLLVQRGLFGEAVRTTYKGILSRLGFHQSKPDETMHARICAVRNVRIALLLAGFFALEVFQSWRQLGKPFAEHNLYDLLFQIAIWVLVLFPVLLAISRCAPERFVVGIFAIRLVTSWVIEFEPTVVESAAAVVRQGYLVLSIFALLASLAMIVSSLSGPQSA
jgi:hypothetical protein